MFLFLNSCPDFLFSESDGKFSDSDFYMYRKDDTYSLQTMSACRYLSSYLHYDEPNVFFSDTEVHNDDQRKKEQPVIETEYVISPKYTDTTVEQVLGSVAGYFYMMYSTEYNLVAKENGTFI